MAKKSRRMTAEQLDMLSKLDTFATEHETTVFDIRHLLSAYIESDDYLDHLETKVLAKRKESLERAVPWAVGALAHIK